MSNYKPKKLHVLKSILFLVFFIAIHSHCYAWSGKVVGISDGDTIEVLHNGYPERIRPYGIDCPEKRQAFGKKAKQFTSKMFLNGMWISGLSPGTTAAEPLMVEGSCSVTV